MHKTQRKSDNAAYGDGWSMILWSVCSILDAALASDIQGFDMALLQKSEDCSATCLVARWHGAFQSICHRYFRGRHSVFAVADHPYAG